MKGKLRIFATAFLATITFCAPCFLFAKSWWTTYPLYLTTFRAYVHSYNPAAPPDDVERLAQANWILAQGNWKLCRRISGKEVCESSFKVMALLPEGISLLKVPRSDTLGSHYNLMAQEMRKLGTPSFKDWYYSDDFEILKNKCVADPAFGTWIVGHAYVRKVEALRARELKKLVARKRKPGPNFDVMCMDMASHWWQSGNDSMPEDDDFYISAIHRAERHFDSLVPGARATGPIKKFRRK